MNSQFSSFTRKLAAIAALTLTLGVVCAQEVDSAELFRKYQKSLVHIKGRKGLGSGEYVRIGNANQIVTNLHVLAQSPEFTINGSGGRQVALEQVALSAAQDLVMFEADSAVADFGLSTDVSKSVKIGDEVMLFSNNDGAGVFAPLQGRVTGMGARLIEIDVAIDANSSGSPIVHLKTGKVIAVATRVPPERTVQSLLRTGEGEPTGPGRQFGQRLDLTTDWERVSTAQLQGELRLVEAVEKRTKELATLESSLRRVRFPNETLATGLTEPLRGQALTFARTLTSAANDRSRAANAAANAARAAASVGSPLTQASANPAQDASLRAGRDRTAAEAKRAESAYNNLWGQYLAALRTVAQSDIAEAKRGAETKWMAGVLDSETALRKQLLEQCVTALEQLKQRGPPAAGRGGRGMQGEEEQP